MSNAADIKTPSATITVEPGTVDIKPAQANPNAARPSVAKSIRDAQTSLKRAGTDARQHVREVNESSVDYIRQNPWHAIGISAGIGLLVGILFGRR